MSAVAREAGRTRGNPQKFLLLTLATQGQGQRSARGLRRAPSKKKSVLNPMHRAPMRAGADWGDCILSIVIECTLYTRATEIEIKRNAAYDARRVFHSAFRVGDDTRTRADEIRLAESRLVDTVSCVAVSLGRAHFVPGAAPRAPRCGPHAPDTVCRDTGQTARELIN
jgi:hypothetical protein